MITIESILSTKNCQRAFDHISLKKNGSGVDKMTLSELKDYWDSNGTRIADEIRSNKYTPGLILINEIINGAGKRRKISRLNSIDRFINRLLSQKLNDYYGHKFQSNSFAYQEGKGVKRAVEKARTYIEAGNEYVVEVDIKDFFDNIMLDKLLLILSKDIIDKRVLELIRSFLYCSVSADGEVRHISNGLVQGMSTSPVLSNVYLTELDEYLEDCGYNWIRFSDNIYIYVDSVQTGEIIYPIICRKLADEFGLPINNYKSGIHDAFERWVLGFEFHKRGNSVIVKPHIYQKQAYYRDWKPCVVERVNKEYHIISDGILNKKDFALLFENPEEKHHIPVEATEQLNIYNEVMITSSVMRTLADEKVRLGIFDKYGNLAGYFIPERFSQDANVLLAQCKKYLNCRIRFDLARKMQLASMHNIRCNLRYYQKKGRELSDKIKEISEIMDSLRDMVTIDQLMLAEARCRQGYYQAFNEIFNEPDFLFSTRTRRPPKDRINALISFGNTLMYNRIQQIIWRTSIDSRIGIVHSTGGRHYSLNLDFADIYKPIIVDRVIFSLINRGQINKDSFQYNESSVLLNKEGKRFFIDLFEKKMKDVITISGKQQTYEQLIYSDIMKYQRYLMDDGKYKPYKHY